MVYFLFAFFLILYNFVQVDFAMPSPDLIVFPCCADRSEPKSGLEPRFEALPKTGKSPNTPGGVNG